MNQTDINQIAHDHAAALDQVRAAEESYSQATAERDAQIILLGNAEARLVELKKSKPADNPSVVETEQAIADAKKAGADRRALKIMKQQLADRIAMAKQDKIASINQCEVDINSYKDNIGILNEKIDDLTAEIKAINESIRQLESEMHGDSPDKTYRVISPCGISATDLVIGRGQIMNLPYEQVEKYAKKGMIEFIDADGQERHQREA